MNQSPEYTRSSRTQLVQEETFNMLKILASTFTTYNIRFYLAYGTALGCVRHKGFIPWDDDVDIYVVAEDYPKVQNLFKQNLISGMSLHDPTMLKGYPYIFPKVVSNRTHLKEKDFEHLPYTCGLYIDIFLLSDAPKSLLRCYFYGIYRYILYGILHAYYSNFSSLLLRLISKLSRLLFNPEKCQCLLYKLYLKKYKSSHTSQYVIDTGYWGRKSILPKSFFTDSLLMKFEDALLPMPGKYDEYLKWCYGNYMTLPPFTQRVPSHNFTFLTFDNK